MHPLYSHSEVFCFDVDHDTGSPERDRDRRDRVADADDAPTPVLAPGRAVLAAAEVTPAVQMWMNICHWATSMSSSFHRDEQHDNNQLHDDVSWDISYDVLNYMPFFG